MFRYRELNVIHDTYASSKSYVVGYWVYNLKTTYPSFNVIQNTT